MVSTFRKADTGKPRMGLLPPRSVVAVARVLTFGATKYAPGNWRKVDDRTRYVDALLRHAFAYLSGERVDAESGLPTLAHLLCCGHFLLELDLEDAEQAKPEPRGHDPGGLY
jgi:hypothetical protein